MRLIGTIENEVQGKQFSAFLEKEGIRNQCDLVLNKDWGSAHYGTPLCKIWVIDEDQIQEAQTLLDEFKSDPDNPRFIPVTIDVGTPIIEIFQPHPPQRPKEQVQESEKIIDITPPSMRPRAPVKSTLTLYSFLLCVLLFVWGSFSEPRLETIPSFLPATPLVAPPIYKVLYFDYPHAYDLVDKLVDLYGVAKLETPSLLPAKGQYLLGEFLETSYWRGFYDMALKYWHQPQFGWHITAPLFEKIREGQVWRAISPAFLHSDIFHLFFNMIWLLVLGKQIEPRMGQGRFLLFILISGVISNTAQYLMGGANFIGYSGILCAMLAYIWVRQQRAPWEGYQVQKATMGLMALFILAMFAIQSFSFLSELFFNKALSPGIANTAHLSGALVGYLLGHINYFSWDSLPNK